MYRWSVCLSITGCRCPVPVQGHRSIAHPSARASARASFIHRSSICSSVCSCIAHPSLIHLLVRLFESGLLVAGPSLLSLTSLSRVSHESLTGLSVRSSLVCLLVQLLGSWSLPRGWSATRLSPIRRWSWPLVRLLVRRALLCPLLCPLLSCLLFCHQSVCSGHGRWLAHPLVVCCSCVIGHGRRSATHAPLVCLLVFPAARLPVALPLVRRCSVCWSICSCIVGLSATLPVVCLLARHSSIRSGHVTRASARLVVARLSVRVVVTGLLVLLLVCCSCVVGHGRRSVIRTSLVRLLDSSLVCRWCVVGVSLTCH